MKSEEPKNPSEQETPFSEYVKTGLSSEEVAEKASTVWSLTKFLKRKLVHIASFWVISGDPSLG